MKLASDNETLAENKALILYLLNKINKAIENTAFYKLVLIFEDMNYFYFQQFLLDLIDNKYILKGLKKVVLKHLCICTFKTTFSI